MRELVSQGSEQVIDILARAVEGRRIDLDEARVLYEEAPLIELGRAAHQRRLELVAPTDVTFLVDRNLNYTNTCITYCSFCAFYRAPGHREGYVNSAESFADKIQSVLDWGGTRILLQGGHNPDLDLAYYRRLLDAISLRGLDVDGFSPSEIQFISAELDMSPRDLLTDLRDHGLTGVPGGGGEILDDEIRSRISPLKINTADWIEMMDIAQSLGLATSATNVIGFGENVEHRLNHFDVLRKQQDRALEEHQNGFTSFISWTNQTENTALGRSKKWGRLGATGREYLRHVAVARLFLDNYNHHSASWPTQGPDLAQVALDFGCDDFGSTMMEENVVSSAGSTYECMTAEDIRFFISNAGYKAVQRDTRYDPVGDGAEAEAPMIGG